MFQLGSLLLGVHATFNSVCYVLITCWMRLSENFTAQRLGCIRNFNSIAVAPKTSASTVGSEVVSTCPVAAKALSLSCADELGRAVVFTALGNKTA